MRSACGQAFGVSAANPRLRARGLGGLWIVLAGLILVAGPVFGASSLHVRHLRCEYAENPLGLGEPRPRLSWVLDSEAREQRQSAYQILVGSEKALARGQGDLWDSGKVLSDRTTHIPYNGPALQSRQRCFWMVRVWDQDGRLIESPPAWWEMGLLQPQDWQARWIGLEQDWPGRAAWSQARWIWPAGATASNVPVPEAFFRRQLRLPEDRPVRRALLRLAADDTFTLYLNGHEVGRNAGKPYSSKVLQEFEVQESLRPGTNLIAVQAARHGTNAGLLGQLVVEFDQGPPLALQTDASWLAHPRGAAGWNTAGGASLAGGPAFGALTNTDWRPARELAAPGQAPWPDTDYAPMLPCPFFRKQIMIQKPVRQARLYVSALGVYECQINGQRVGNDHFNPQWTDYHTRVQYHAYDVTALLRHGANALGVILGDGWYAGFAGLGGRCRYGRLPLALAQLEMELADGTRLVLATDGSWKAATGPLRRSDFLMGEEFDARLDWPGWSRAWFDDSAWLPVVVGEPKTRLAAATDEPVRKTQELITRAHWKVASGVEVFDLGQNITGWARLKVRGQAGRAIQLRFAEMLNPDGSIYTANLREARCTDRFIPRGAGEETYEPRFTFHGFRYVEVSGCAGGLDPDALTGIVAHSDTAWTGRFECSSPLVSQLQRNITWSQRGNSLSVPTDCPQRDERLGWTGDGQVFLPTAAYNMNVARFFAKWCQDIADAQLPDGAFSDVAPSIAGGRGAAAWGDAGVICPWTLYQFYGDERILERHFDAGQRWVDYLAAHSTGLIRPAAGYGDWLAPGDPVPKDLLATAYFARAAWILSRMAGVLQRPAEARKYQELFDRVREAFLQRFTGPEGLVPGGAQTAYACALQFGLFPEAARPAAAARLAAAVRSTDAHLTTGFIGAGLILPALTEAGEDALARRLLLQEGYPSWLYPVKLGATTLWERWDGWTPDKGFQTPSMNSFNHYALGAVGSWLYESVAGIACDPAGPGFRRILVHPRPGEGLTWARGEYRSVSGWIYSYWRIEEGTFKLDTTIPANTSARVFLPVTEPERVLEDGRAAARSKGVKSLQKTPEGVVAEVASGTYRFSVPWVQGATR